VTLDTDTTVRTLYGNQMGARKSYNPKNKGKKSYQPMLTFIAETREYLWGELRNGESIKTNCAFSFEKGSPIYYLVRSESVSHITRDG
jgi:hypothetical protein